jgi:hypothetical protein
MRRGIAAFATLIVAVGAMAGPSLADGQMVVTVREPGGSPAKGAVVAIKQTVGDAGAAAVLALGVTGQDGTVDLLLDGVRSPDVYSITADHRTSGGRAATTVFAGGDAWPPTALTLKGPARAIHSEVAAARTAAAACDQVAYGVHVARVQAAIESQASAAAALDSAIARYAHAFGLSASNSEGIAAADESAEHRHYVRLRQLATNVHSGLEADRAKARAVPGLAACSNETRAGVEMLARCPPGWEANAGVASRSDRRECRQRPPGYEPDRN